MTIFVLRQNPGGKYLNFCDYIRHRDTNFVLCPWGMTDNQIQNINNRTYNEDAKKQDKKFIEELKEGDYILTPSIDRTHFTLKRITNTEYHVRFIPNFLYVNQGTNIDWDIINNNTEQINQITTTKELTIAKSVCKTCEFIAELPNSFLYENNNYNFSNNRQSITKLCNQEALNRIQNRIQNIQP